MGAVALFALICGALLPLKAQNPDQFADVAAQVTSVVAASHQERILLAPLQGCLLDPPACAALDTALRSALNVQIPKVQLAGPEQILPLVRSSKLLAVDAYNGWVLQSLITRTPSKILITEHLAWSADGYDVVCEVMDTGKHKVLGTFSETISLPAPDTKPVIFKDPDTGVALVVERADQNRGWPTGVGIVFLPPGTENHSPHPMCVDCPMSGLRPSGAWPKGAKDDLLLLYSVTENGTVEDIDVVRATDPELTAGIVKAMAHWQFRPAVGPDGKPFATRRFMDMPVTFH
jgi:hypothetical protein